MGQNNNCIQNQGYRTQGKEVDMRGGRLSSRKSKKIPRLRNAFSTSTFLEEDSPRGVSAQRRSSLPKFLEEKKNLSDNPNLNNHIFERLNGNRRDSFSFQAKRSFRGLLSGRSFQSRKSKESLPSSSTPLKSHPKLRGRSSSLGHIIVSMAHHRLRSGASPSPRRAAEKKNSGDDLHQNATQDNENYQPASVESLVRRCAACFVENGECSDEEFPRMLFLTHPWFMTSEQLAVLFSKMYEDGSTTTDLKMQILYAISYWMKEFPQVFDLDAALVEAIKNLQKLAADDDQVDESLVDLSNSRGKYRWMRSEKLSLRPAQNADRKRRKVSLVFHHLEPEELAIHLSYLEYKCFRRLTFEDFHKYAVRATIKDIARLERCVFLFNNITLWVQCMVLGQHTPQERAAVITKYIKIAQKLHEMRNYNTLMAVVGGLTHTAIARLKKTMSSLSRESIKALDEMVDLLDSRSNYVAYRRDYANQGGVFKIPIIGVHLKDIISLHTAMLDRIGDGLINVKKMVSIGSIFQELLNLQRSNYPHDVNKDLVNTLRVSLYLYYTEEEIYALSLQREPRDAKNSVSSTNSPSKAGNMLFAEFTKFTCQLDNKTVTQHVKAMVESVFKAYDHDNDGFISEEEFDSFKDNFPMMESFSAMDVDRDGKISRDEMCEYFMKASACRRNDFCQNFTHEFVETTYFHPAFCEECEKLLWGLVKQGWKCKGCGINCHKHCKDRIVQECRAKQPTNHPSVKTNGARHTKSSVSSESDVSANGDVASVSNASVQGSHLDDETFDSPGELTHFKPSPAAMRRTSSLASADTTGRVKNNRLHDSRTPPLPRKHQDGKKSFQDKMLRIIPRRNNSNKSRITSDAATQTPPGTPPPSTPNYQPKKSFLYPKCPNSPMLSPITKSRLGSCGEEIEEINSQSNNNHVTVTTTPPTSYDKLFVNQVTRDSRHDAMSTSSSQNSVRYPSFRRDSGLSGCFTAASYDSSLPVTPDFHTRLGNQMSNAFKFPPNFAYEELNMHNNVSEKTLNLMEENARLQKTNEKLTTELKFTKEHVAKLEKILKENNLQVPTLES